MLVIDELRKALSAHNDRLGFDTSLVEQRSEEWHRMRLGVITASKAHAFLAGQNTETYASYIAEKAAEKLTGTIPEEISASALQWGKDNEEGALYYFSFITGLHVDSIPFIYKDNEGNFGCSPDGICNDGIGLEIKCPYSSREFIKFVITGQPKPEETKQVQFCMWVTGAKSWYVAKFDPRFQSKQLHYILMERDELLMRAFDEKAIIALKDLDNIYKHFG